MTEIVNELLKINRPTFIGFHGYRGEWLHDNPDLTKELLNLSGYWYFPKSIHSTHFKKGNLSFEIEWLNKGVAPAYSTYELKERLIAADGSENIEFLVEDSGNKNWMPKQVSVEKYTINLISIHKGEYQLAIQLFDKKTGKPVDLGLITDIKENDYFILQNLTF